MPLVCASLVEVIRTRKALEAAFAAGDWQQVQSFDERMGDMMDLAFADENRDNTALVGELEKVLGIYARLVAYLPESAAQRWLSAVAPSQ